MGVSLSRVSLTLIFFLLGACSGEPPDIPVAQKWNDAIKRYNLIPIYPMQEDVQIGDVFLYIPPLTGVGDLPPSVWLNRLSSPSFADILNELTDDYCRRIRIQPAATTTTPPATNAPPGATPSSGAVGVTIHTTTTVQGVSNTQDVTVPPPSGAKKPPAPAAKKPTAGNAAKPTPPTQWPYETRCPPKPPATTASMPPTGDGSTTAAPPYPFDIQRELATSDLRMHRVELPEIAVASVTDAELAAAVPISAFLGKIGLGASSNVGLDISLTGIEEVHLPFDAVFRLFQKERESFVAENFPPGIFLEYLYQKRPDLLESACFVDLKTLNASGMVVMVANEVVYAHGISYSYKSSSTFAGQLGAALATAASKSNTGTSSTSGGGYNVTTTVTNNSSPTTAPTTTTPPPASPISDAQAALTAESAKIAALTGSLTGPGGALQFGIGRSGNLTLSDKFAQPLAFGIGDLLEFAPADLLVLYRSTAQDPNPPYGKEIIDNANRWFPVYCSPVPPPGKLSLVHYLSATDAETQAMAPSPPPRRFRPSEGLPTRGLPTR